ncbi:MAG: GNAT family N-acetyltransferase [Candidatus Eremiobacteraeota bacterium]|nr:GNAT family N-acetyltransferase [Candidatus Eremiobacteraeota bacterium]
MRTLRTQRLRLVPVTSANAPVLWQVIQSPDLRDYQDLPVVNRTQFMRAIAARPTHLEPGTGGRYEWLVHFSRGPEALGWVSLRVAEPSTSSGELGYSVVREYRGRGVATEAVAAIVDEGFRCCEFRRIRAYCLPENHASRAVLRHNGFTDEGILPRGASVGGKPVDVIVHTLERQQWIGGATRSRQATRS